MLLLTLRGTPFLYQGEELGLLDAVIPAERRVDPGGRDGCRAPIPWDGAADHGWPTAAGVEPWLPFPPESDHRNHHDQRDDNGSILHLYRRLIALRHRSPALTLGAFDLLETPEGVLGYRRTLDDDAYTVLINFTGEGVAVHTTGTMGRHGDGSGPAAGMRVEVSTTGSGEGQAFDGWLAADQVVLLRP